VTTPFSYAKEIIDKESRGYFIDFKSSDSIVKALSHLIENPKKIEETRLRAYQFGRDFTWQKMTEEFIQILQKAALNPDRKSGVF
jgi:glycosyltransferase involved in cell wall biosynthesis